MSHPMDRKKFLWLYGLTIAVAIALRWPGIDRGLEYDEIWPLQQYRSTSVMTLLSRRDDEYNLHPLHNILVTMYPDAGPIRERYVRIGVLLSGICVVVVGGCLAWQIIGDPFAVVLAMWLLGFHPALVHYSQTARGYSYEICFGLLLYWLVTTERLRAARLGLWSTLVGLCVLLLQMSVVTGIMVWLPILGYFFVAYGLKNRLSLATLAMRCLTRPTLLPLLASMMLSGAWLILIHPALAKGQRFGQAFEPTLAFLQHILETLTWGLWAPMGILAIVSLFVTRDQHLSRCTLVLLAVTGVSIPFVGLGPPRVYTYLIPFVLLAIPIAFCRSITTWIATPARRVAAKGIGLLLIGGLAVADQQVNRTRWRTEIDYKQLPPLLLAEEQGDSYLVFGNGDGRCVKFYHHLAVVQNNFMHFADNRAQRQLLLVHVPGEHAFIPGYDRRANVASRIDVPPSTVDREIMIGGVPCSRVPLTPLAPNAAGRHGVLLAVTLSEFEEFERWESRESSSASDSGWSLVNVWLTQPLMVATRENPTPREMICAVYCTEVADREDLERSISALSNPHAQYFWCGR